jgi:hypothetical protein
VANDSTPASPAALESEASDFGRANAEATNFVFLTEETQMADLACSIVDAGTLTQLDAGSISSFGGHLSNFVDGAVPLSMSGGSGIASVDDAKAIAPIFQKMGHEASVATLAENVAVPETIKLDLEVLCQTEDIHSLG